MLLLRHMRVSRQITLFVFVLAAVLIGTATVGLMTLKDAMIEDRRATLSRLVDAAVGIAESWRAEEVAGRMTREQAQAAALRQLRALRFGPEKDYYFIQGYDGTSVLNPGSPQLEGKVRLDGVDADGVPNVRQQIEAARQPQGGFVFYRFPRAQGQPPIQKLSFSKGIDAWQWAVCTGIYLDDVDAAWESEALRIGVPLLVAIAVLMAGAVIVSKGIAGPLKRLVDTLAQLSSGNRTIEIKDTDRRNEIGALARSVSDFKEALLLAERLDQEKRAADTEQARRHEHLARVTRSFGDNMDTVAQALTGAAAHLTDRAKRLAEEAQVTLSRADTVRTASSVASNTAVTIATSTEQMTSSISEIGRSMTEASRVAQAAVVETEGAQLRMASLSAAVKKIGEIVGLVNSIAAQTNLLALNATIEAARAGEAGKGFAVVASEVKNLASQTTRATEEISSQITEIQDETGHFVSIISRITETIGTIGRVTVSVAAQIEQQEAGAAEISQALSHASTSAADIDAGILDVTKEAEAARSDAAVVLAAAEDVAGHSSQLGQSVKTFLNDLEAA